jgi:hypothetical protein
MSEQILSPIELTDDQLELVAGGITSSIVLVGVLQLIGQSASVEQKGGSVVIGGSTEKP